LRNSEKEVRKT
jgi:hypothetical protein